MKKIYFSLCLILAILALSQNLSGQCSPFEFEITPIAPVLTSGISTATSPSAFQAYYKVKLKGANNSNLPANWSGALLQISGRFTSNNPLSNPAKLNGFTARINKMATQVLAPIGGVFNSSNLQITNAETGDFVWIFGSATAGCAENPIAFGNNVKSVELFTIVVEAVPGETISLTSLSAEQKSCSCTASVPVTSSVLGGYNLTFGAPVSCSNAAISFALQNSGFRNVIYVNMSGVVGNADRFDGVIHIEPQMNGIVNLNFATSTAYMVGLQTLNYSPLQFEPIRKNTDGSFDIYFYLPPFTNWNPTASPDPQPIFYIELLGQFNQSQGGKLVTSLTNSRVSWTTPTPLVCSPLGLNSTIMIPGSPSCQSGTKLSMLPYLGSSCSLAVEYRFDNLTPVTFKNLKLKFWVEPDDILNTLLPIVKSSNLGAGTINFVPAVGGFGAHYEFDFSTTSNITIDKNTFVQIPFNLKSDCVTYYVITAEGTEVGSNDLCSFPIIFDLTKIPACNPEITGTVRQPNGHVTPLNPTINLIWANSSYNLSTDVDCPKPYDVANPYDNNASYTFCPNPLGKPFQLWMPNKTTDYLYGVDMFDVAVLTKHILNITPFTQAYQYVAADVGGSAFVTTGDIVQLRKIILGIINNFGDPNIFPSWRYFKEDYAFLLPPNFNPVADRPYIGANIADVTNQFNYRNFISVKLGDVDFSGICDPDGFAPSENEDRVSNAFDISATYAAEKNQVKIDFYKNSGISWIAAQSGFRFDNRILSFSKIIPNELISIKRYDFNDKAAENGEIRFGWASHDGETTLSKNPLLFSIVFDVNDLRALDLNKLPIWLASDLMPNLSFDVDGHKFPLSLNERQTIQNSNIAPKIAVFPNPANDRAAIKVMSEMEGAATLQIANLQGVEAVSSSLSLIKGENSIDLDTKKLTNGLYLISVKMPGAQTANYRFSVIH